MELNADSGLPVQRLFAVSEKLKFSIENLKNAGMMKKAESAAVVVSDIHDAMQLQNKLINTLVYEVLNLKQAVELLKERAGL